MLKIKNNVDSAELYISGSIIDDEDGGWFEAWDDPGTGYEWPKVIKEQLDAIDENSLLTIYINSDGGSVPAGVAIANMIARHKGHTIAIVDGWACSIATQIFFAADERRIPSNSYLMIHKPTVGAVSGDANDMRRMAETLDVLQDGLETTYNRVTREGVTPEQVHQMVEDSTWLTGADAAELFDIELLEASQTAAYAGSEFKSFSNMPDGIKFVAKVPEQVSKKQIPATEPKLQDAYINKMRAAIQLAIMEGEILDEKI